MMLIRAGLAAALLCSATPSLLAQLYLRGQAEPVQGQIVAVSSAGVSIAQAGETPTVVSWDRVRVVRGESSAQAATFADSAQALWRARTRVERSDFAGAEPILERLAALPPVDALTGPSAAVLAECLLRCRLERGAQAGATRAWLVFARTAVPPAGPPKAPAVAGHQLIDAGTGLCPALPPMFVRDAALIAAADAPPDADTPLARLYTAALAADAGRPTVWTSELASGLPESARVLAEILQARTGTPPERAAARAALTSRLVSPDLAPWLDAWCHVALGRSLVRESDPGLRRQGVLHLLQAPARLGRSAPYLASLSLLEAAQTMQALGEPDAAASIRAELKDRFSRWPAARAAAADLQDPAPNQESKEQTAD